MSHISVRPLSDEEFDLIGSLDSLSISGANQGIAKTSSTTFANVTFSGGGSALTVTDGSTTVTNTSKITISGGTVTNSGGGNATITVTGGGVTSITGTANQVIADQPTGAVTLSLPQSIATTSTPQFARLGLGVAADANNVLKVVTTDTTHAGIYVSTQTHSSANGSGITIDTSAANNNHLAFSTAGTVRWTDYVNTALDRAWATATAVRATLSANGTFTLSPANDTTSLTLTGGSITGSGTTSFQTLTGTWNTSGVVDGAVRIAITETASGANSSLFSIYGGASATTNYVTVAKAGLVGISNSTPDSLLTIGPGTIAFGAAASRRVIVNGAGQTDFFVQNTSNSVIFRLTAENGVADAIIGTASNHPFGIITNNATIWSFATAGHFTANTDNTYDIGASGATRPRTLYLGTSIKTPAFVAPSDSTTAMRFYKTDGSTVVGGWDTTNGRYFVGTSTNTSASLQINVAAASYSLNSSTGTNAVFGSYTNTGGSAYLGVESSTGGSLLTGAIGYAYVMAYGANRPIQWGTNDTVRMTLSAAGGLSIGNTTDPGAANLNLTGRAWMGGATLANDGTLVVAGSSSSNTSTGAIFRFDTNSGSNDSGFKIGALAGSGAAGYAWIQAVATGVGFDRTMVLQPTSGGVSIGTVTAAGAGNLLVNGTITSGSLIKSGTSFNAADGSYIFWNTRAAMKSTANSKISLTNNADSTGVTLDFATTGTLKLRNYADNGDGILTAANTININNAVTCSSNAATVPVTSGVTTVTNDSAGTFAITITTTGAVDRQKLVVCILDFSGVAQTIGWTNTENSLTSVPTTSAGSTTKPLYVGFVFNSATTKWACVAST